MSERKYTLHEMVGLMKVMFYWRFSKSEREFIDRMYDGFYGWGKMLTNAEVGEIITDGEVGFIRLLAGRVGLTAQKITEKQTGGTKNEALG